MGYRLWVIGLLLFALPLQAIETIIVGEIVNETTGEAIPNVNIHFRGTKIGTTSDENGSYALRVDMTAKTQLVFSAVGYYTQRFDIEPGTMAGLQVAMRERVATLTEVVVAPNENPALEILRQVRAHREDNDRTMHPENSATLQREQQTPPAAGHMAQPARRYDSAGRFDVHSPALPRDTDISFVRRGNDSRQ